VRLDGGSEILARSRVESDRREGECAAKRRKAGHQRGEKTQNLLERGPLHRDSRAAQAELSYEAQAPQNSWLLRGRASVGAIENDRGSERLRAALKTVSPVVAERTGNGPPETAKARRGQFVVQRDQQPVGSRGAEGQSIGFRVGCSPVPRQAAPARQLWKNLATRRQRSQKRH